MKSPLRIIRSTMRRLSSWMAGEPNIQTRVTNDKFTRCYSDVTCTNAGCPGARDDEER